MLTLEIDRNLEDAVYEQIADQVRRFVATGALAPGTKLPSVRQLAGNLGVNLNTVARAYRLLDEEGFLVIRSRAGVTVAAPTKKIESSAQTKLLDQMRVILARLRQAGMAPDELMVVIKQEVQDMGGSTSGGER